MRSLTPSLRGLSTTTWAAFALSVLLLITSLSLAAPAAALTPPRPDPTAPNPWAASAGPGRFYRARAFDLVPLPWAWLSFHGNRVMPLPKPGPRDAAGIPLFRWHDGKLYYRPGMLAIGGMRRLDDWVRKGDPAQLAQSLLQARKLREIVDHARSAWWLPFEYDYGAEGLRGPWYNAMTQGLVLSFFVRLHRITGDPVHLDAARHVFDSFLRLGPKPDPWVARVLDGYLWLEHYPEGNSDRVLNAHLHAIFGVFDYWQETGDPDARHVLEGAITTMRDQVHRFRRSGELSRYCLCNSVGYPKYHAIHIWQLRVLARLSGDGYFARIAERMEADHDPNGAGPGAPGPLR